MEGEGELRTQPQQVTDKVTSPHLLDESFSDLMRMSSLVSHGVSFSDFLFKIRPIRLGFSFQKQKNPVFEPLPTDSHARLYA